jgi:hypothetical protein
MFKDLLKEYRRLDDTITMRLNRTNAQFRDRDRAGTSSKGNIQDQACAYVWKELVENWKRRTEMINYCVDIVDQSMDGKRKSLTSEEGDARAERKAQAVMFADEVKRNQVHNELAVEKIVRQRSLDGEDVDFVSHVLIFDTIKLSVSIKVSVFFASIDGCRGAEVVGSCSHPRISIGDTYIQDTAARSFKLPIVYQTSCLYNHRDDAIAGAFYNSLFTCNYCHLCIVPCYPHSICSV